MITLTLVRYGDLPRQMEYAMLAGDLVYCTARVLPVVLHFGWENIERLFRLPASLIQAGHSHRDLVRVTLPELNEQAYLKRELGTYRKDRLTAFVIAGRYTTRCVQEYVALKRLLAAGIVVPKPMALWLRRDGSRVQAALMLEELPDREPLDLALARLRCPEARVRVAHRLAEFLARIHDAHIHDPDLFSWHILVRSGRLEAPDLCVDDFALLDLQRAVVVSWKPCCVRRARDLGALLASLDEQIFPEQCRRALLTHYFDTAQPRDPWRPLFPKVLERRIRRWRSRRKVLESLELQRPQAARTAEPSRTSQAT